MKTPIVLFPLAAMITLVAFAATATAQEELPEGFKRCGDPNLVLVFMNPDLKPQSDGFVHASGSFFIQFQARGEPAMNIETFKFSFGAYTTELDQCTTPEWVTGAYIKNFRADYDWRDGFFVNINTCNVPDGTYAAAISAYDKDLNELARYYTRAVVENGATEPSTSAQRCQNPDKTAPWPMVLPGDGQIDCFRPDCEGGQGLYIEVAEPVTSVEAWVNERPVQLTEGKGPERDDDLAPDLGYHPAIRDGGLSQGHATKVTYPAFTYDGAIRADDVVRVRVVDQWGNVATKTVHLGDPTIGGRVAIAPVKWEIDLPVKDAEADANGTAVLNVTYRVTGTEPVHADINITNADGGPLPKGIDYRLDPAHIQTNSGNVDVPGTIRLIASPDAELGTYNLMLTAVLGHTKVDKQIPLTFRVTQKPSSDFKESEEFADPAKFTEQQDVSGTKVNDTDVVPAATEGDDKGVPGPAPLALVAAAAAIALARKRKA